MRARVAAILSVSSPSAGNRGPAAVHCGRRMSRHEPLLLYGHEMGKTTEKTLAGSVGPSISVRPFRFNPALLVAAQTAATRSNSLPGRQLRARTVTSSETAIASRDSVGVDRTDVGRGEARRARSGRTLFLRIAPVLAAVLPHLDRPDVPHERGGRPFLVVLPVGEALE